MNLGELSYIYMHQPLPFHILKENKGILFIIILFYSFIDYYLIPCVVWFTMFL